MSQQEEATVEDDIFIGRAACVINDPFRRGCRMDGVLPNHIDRKVTQILVKPRTAIESGTVIPGRLTSGAGAPGWQ